MEPPWDQLLCSEYAGVRFIQAKFKRIPILGLYLNFGKNIQDSVLFKGWFRLSFTVQ